MTDLGGHDGLDVGRLVSKDEPLNKHAHFYDSTRRHAQPCRNQVKVRVGEEPIQGNPHVKA